MKAVAAVNFGGLIDIPGNLLKAVAEQKHGKRNPHCGIGDHRRPLGIQHLHRFKH